MTTRSLDVIAIIFVRSRNTERHSPTAGSVSENSVDVPASDIAPQADLVVSDRRRNSHNTKYYTGIYEYGRLRLKHTRAAVYYSYSSQFAQRLSWHSTTPTPTSSPTSSRRSSRECRRVVQLAAGITSGNRACRTFRRASSQGCPCRCRCRRRGMPALPHSSYRLHWM